MNKKQVQQRVLLFGKPLGLDKFNWDEDTSTFFSDEDDLVLDFNGVKGVTFNTGSVCTFKTGIDCIFNTGSGTFKTGADCTFDTGSLCTFDTGKGCVVVRRDIYEVIELKAVKSIKLNGPLVKGDKQ